MKRTYPKKKKKAKFARKREEKKVISNKILVSNWRTHKTFMINKQS